MGLEYLNDIEDTQPRDVKKADLGKMKLSLWDKKREVYKHVDCDVSESRNIRPLLPIIAKNNGVEVEELFYYEGVVPPLTEGLNNTERWKFGVKMDAENFDKLQALRAKMRKEKKQEKNEDEEQEEETKFTKRKK